MGCGNCSSGNGVPKGCKSNGACGVGGCGKLSVYDWLADIDLPGGQSTYDVVEVRFKNSRKGFFRNMKDIQLQVGDAVVVESSPGHDVGVVSVVGELARIQVRKKAPGFKPHEARKIYRKATRDDLDKWKEAREKEQPTMFHSRVLASELALDMKISDVEYQGDGSKATFYYTAEDRIDFRQLIKDLADAFKVRVEMKQIGVRQEAARLGGIGSCGRELCCSTWLTDFRSVSTAAARYQQLSLNPQKLAGQCGKLKCCLNYELDSYLDALKDFPSSEIKLHTEKGTAFHVKTDVFKRQMWYLQEERNDEVSKSVFIPLSPDDVKEIIDMNKTGKKPTDLSSYVAEVEVQEPDYTNVVGQDSLNRFDNAFKKKRKKKKKGGTQQQGNAQAQTKQGNQQQSGAQQPNKQTGHQNQNKQAGQSDKGKGGEKRNDGNRPKQSQGANNKNQPLKNQGNQQNQQQPKGNKPDQKPKTQPAGDQSGRPQNNQNKEGGEGAQKRRNKNRNRNRNKNNNSNKSEGDAKADS